MAIIFPCSMSVEAYAAAGKQVEVPRPDCPICLLPMMFWYWYSRSVRVDGQFLRIWIRRARCSRCRVSHGLQPSFLFLGRYDPAEVIGSVIEAVAMGRSRLGPAAERAGVLRNTARNWLRRFSERASELTVSFSACAIELGGAVVALTGEARRDAVVAIEAAFEAASDLPGWADLGRFGFCSRVTGGRLIAPNTIFPAILLGKRRFIAPVL
jgi:hypothetical protein